MAGVEINLKDRVVGAFFPLLNTSSLILTFLCYLIGFISLLTLNDRFWNKNYFLPVLFLYFLVIVNYLCQASSIFELFIYYELLLLPSIYFVYKSGYTKKSYFANVYFFVWTQTGSLIVLLAIVYISVKCGTTEFLYVKNFKFTKDEVYFLYLAFFFGFGVKVPLWPFHFWLIKVHVEAPSGFSIYLSGFLVKTAVFCFYKIILLLNIKTFYLIPVLFCLMGMLDSSLKMWSQTDIKKLIAYATVQEMNAIYLMFNFGDSWSLNSGLIFLLAHGILSALMFFLVECIYKRTNTRSLYKLYGLSQLYPNLHIIAWGMLILYLGLPGTLKFYCEIQLCFLLVSNDGFSAFFILFIFIFLNGVGFAKCWFSILYGHPGYLGKLNKKMDLTKEEIMISLLLIGLSFFMCLILYAI